MKNHKFTWIDGLVAAVLLLLVVGTTLKFLVLNPAADESTAQTFQYQLEIQGLRQYSVDALEIGDTVYDNTGKGVVGVISEISVGPAKGTFHSSEGTVQETEYLDRYDVVLTLSAQGIQEDGVWQVGTYALKLNQSSLYFTKYSIWSARIIAIL